MSRLPFFSTIRLISIAVVAIAAFAMPTPFFKAFFTSALFGHYALSFYYSKRQLGNLAKKRTTWIPLGILAAGTLVYIFTGAYVWLLAPFIGLHIALSETYMISGQGDVSAKLRWHLNLSRYLVNAFIYVLLLHTFPVFSFIPVPVALLGLATSFGYFAFIMKRDGHALDASAKTDLLIFEASGVAVGLVLFASGIAMAPPLFVYYHVTTWILYPAANFYRRGDRSQFSWFLGQTAVVTAVFFALSTMVDLPGAIPMWATLHFVSSFPLSRLNPTFITKLFYPA